MDVMDAEFFEFEDVTWQTVPPPARHPIPAAYVRDLEVGDELTIGIPNRYFIDGQMLIRPAREAVMFPEDGEMHESLAVCAPMFYWTWVADPRRKPVMQWWPVAHAWVYRDAVAHVDPSSGILARRDREVRAGSPRLALVASSGRLLLGASGQSAVPPVAPCVRLRLRDSALAVRQRHRIGGSAERSLALTARWARCDAITPDQLRQLSRSLMTPKLSAAKMSSRRA